MDMLSYLKNPIVLGILTAVLVYLYLYWEEEQKHKKHPKIEKKSVSFITPAVIGVIVWFISSSYFEKYDNSDQEKIETENQRQQGGQFDNQISKPINKISNLVDPYSGSNVVTDSHQSSKVNTHGIHTRSSGHLSDSVIDSKSFYLIGKNKLELPNIDVFIDVARF